VIVDFNTPITISDIIQVIMTLLTLITLLVVWIQGNKQSKRDSFDIFFELKEKENMLAESFIKYESELDDLYDEIGISRVKETNQNNQPDMSKKTDKKLEKGRNILFENLTKKESGIKKIWSFYEYIGFLIYKKRINANDFCAIFTFPDKFWDATSDLRKYARSLPEYKHFWEYFEYLEIVNSAHREIYENHDLSYGHEIIGNREMKKKIRSELKKRRKESKKSKNLKNN